MSSSIETVSIGHGGTAIEVPRIFTGLWQLAGGHEQQVDMEAAVEVMKALVDRGLYAFDMADQEVIGAFTLKYPDVPIRAFTKWCPKPSKTSADEVTQAIDLSRRRMNRDQLDLLQFHTWDYGDLFWLDRLDHLAQLTPTRIRNLAFTDVDLAHLQMAHGTPGIRIASNQVSISILDRRALKGGMCQWAAGNGVALLAFGVLLGGFLSEKWLDKPEPGVDDLDNWSLMKYKRYIDHAGGWAAFQRVLKCLSELARKHGVNIPAIATRYVLSLPGVACAIIGSRLTPSSTQYTDATLSVFSFTLSSDDMSAIEQAQEGLADLPGDCGDEYRREPYLTASGDLSHHLNPEAKLRQGLEMERAARDGRRVEYTSGSKWEPMAGYTRAVRIGSQIAISGTTAPYLPSGSIAGGESAALQTVRIFDLISAALTALGGSLRDVIRTRILLEDENDCAAVTAHHRRVFERQGVRPANTTLGGVRMVGPGLKVEIEVEAVLGSSGEVLRLGP